MRIPPLVWLILTIGALSALALFGIINHLQTSKGREQLSEQINAEEEKQREPIMGWLQIEAESPVPPTGIEIFREGTLLVEMQSPGFDSAHGGEFVFPVDGVSLGVYAKWEDYLPGPRAVRFKATFEGTEISSYVLWGNGDEASGVWKLPAIELADTTNNAPPADDAAPQNSAESP